MFCTNCGKKLYEGDRFCAYCGTKVREEEPKSRQEIVFNPPFRAEAERRTSEIFKGFSESSEELEKPRRTEPAHFDWNLDGFPSSESKKTEDVDFNWDSVMDRKRDVKRNTNSEELRFVPAVPIVDKIDINGPKIAEKPVEHVEEPAKEPVKEPAKEPEPVQEKIQEKTSEKAAASLEDELFGKDYRPVTSAETELRSGNTAQLEKFYTYNEKKEAFQELLDKEYERLRSMEEERKPDAESLEFTWAGRLFPQPDEEPDEEPDKEPGDEPESGMQQETVSGDTIDFTPIRKETRLRSQMEQGPEQALAALKFEEPRQEEPTAEEPAVAEAMAEEPAIEQPVEKTESEGPESEGPESEEPEFEEPAGDDATPSFSQEEKPRLRYSDVFPREGTAVDSDGSISGGTEPAADDAESEKNEKRMQGKDLSGIFDEEEEEEKKGMNPFIKLIVVMLVLLIVLEGVVLAAKFIAPESAFSIQANAFVEKILDKVTGGSGSSQDGQNPSKTDGNSDADLPKETYLSGILREKVPEPETIGQVLEDTELKYDNKKTYAFGDPLAEAEAFVDETWKTGEDGKTITKAEIMMNAVVTYFDQWKATNEDTSLIGINKLEIGEIRTGEEGYYVLCRLTFAGEDGGEVVKYVTVNVKESQDSMVINETKEETI